MLKPQGHVDNGVSGTEVVGEVPLAFDGGDQRHRQNEQGSEEVHCTQVSDQDEVDATHFQLQKAESVFFSQCLKITSKKSHFQVYLRKRESFGYCQLLNGGEFGKSKQTKKGAKIQTRINVK